MKPHVVRELIEDCLDNPRNCPGENAFLSGHNDRIRRLSTLCQECRRSFYIVGNYLLVSFQDPYIARRDDKEILDLLREALSIIFSPYKHLAAKAGPGAWILEYLRSGVGTIFDLFELDSDRPLALAAVIGVDNESKKLFTHILPPMHSMITYLCRKRLKEKTIRLLMGFDKHYWEYTGGRGRLRIQGDLVMEVLREYAFERLDSTYHYTVSALTFDSILAYLRNYIEDIIKARVLEELERSRLEGLNVEKAIVNGVTQGLIEVIGEKIGRLEVRTLIPEREVPSDTIVYQVYFTWLYVDDGQYAPYFMHKNPINTSKIIYKPVVRMGMTPKPDAPKMEYYEFLSGPLKEADGPRKSLLYWISSSSQILVDLTYPVNVAYTALSSILTSELRGTKGIDWSKFCRETAYLLNPVILSKVKGIICKMEKSARISGINIENHKLSLEGFRITGTQYAHGVMLEYMNELINTIIEAGREPAMNLCQARFIDAISKAFALKTGEELVLVKDTVSVVHPEHGETAISFPRPVLARVTLLNTWDIPSEGEESEEQ